MSYPKPTKPVPKRLIICCDGTWQSSVSGKNALPSNITRLARLLALAAKDSDGKEWQQVVYYHAGVGTGALSEIERARQGATGDGLIINLIDCYNFVVNNYELGDQVFCFGFSRGAYTARAVAGLINDLGILKPKEMQHFPTLLAIYEKNTSKHNFRKTREFYEFLHGTSRVSKDDQYKSGIVPFWETGHGDPTWGEKSRIVELVGVFDTVGSLGIADVYGISMACTRRRYQFLNVNWSPYINHAFHALALDECRSPFAPSLFYIPSKETLENDDKACRQDTDSDELINYRKQVDRLAELQRASSPPDLKQVWFTGCHVNVGGGNSHDGLDHEGLANITIAWMIEQCRPYLAFDAWALTDCQHYINHVIAQEKEIQAQKLSEAGPRDAAKVTQFVHEVEENVSDFVHHRSPENIGVLGTALDIDADPTRIPHPPEAYCWVNFEEQSSYSSFYAMIGNRKVRHPGEGVDQTVDPHPQLRDLGETHEWVHPSVRWRMIKSRTSDDKKCHYKSKALEGFHYRKNEFEMYGWFNSNRGIWIPECPITIPLSTANGTGSSNGISSGGVRGVGGDGGIEDAEVSLIDVCLDGVEVKAHLRKVMVGWNHAEEEEEVLIRKARTPPKETAS